MNRFVLEASVTLAWCFEDERSAYADRLLDGMVPAGAAVPAIWPLEVANALLVAERRRRLTRAKAARTHHVLEGLPITIDSESAARAFDQILELARAHHLSVYDAAYLELALREGLALATLDERLRRAARHAGVEVAA